LHRGTDETHENLVRISDIPGKIEINHISDINLVLPLHLSVQSCPSVSNTEVPLLKYKLFCKIPAIALNGTGTKVINCFMKG
jgi:hypothetical protein